MSNGLDFYAGIENVSDSRRFQRPIYEQGADVVEVVEAFASFTDDITPERYPLLASTWGYHNQRIEPEDVARFIAELKALMSALTLTQAVRAELEALTIFAADCERHGYAVLSSGP
jgi:hypothetical protein